MAIAARATRKGVGDFGNCCGELLRKGSQRSRKEVAKVRKGAQRKEEEEGEGCRFVCKESFGSKGGDVQFGRLKIRQQKTFANLSASLANLSDTTFFYLKILALLKKDIGAKIFIFQI